jgi:DNA-binding MarR family transcriptional regulator
VKGGSPKLDPIIHAPVRLRIAAMLGSVSDAEFATLREITGVSDSVLSKHLKQLEDAGYVKLHKAAAAGHVRTRIALTRAGRQAFASHVAALQELASVATLPVSESASSPIASRLRP